jgi:hypothetical protein
MSYTQKYLTLLTIFTGLLLLSCEPDTIAYPCESVICFNGGECAHGNCLCEDGYAGDSCETPTLPESILISEISLSYYPTFRDEEPWDMGLPTPYCWPDLAILIQWPWTDIDQSWVINNCAGSTVSWDSEIFPFIKDNHFHYGDELLLTVIEIDGVDSLETVQAPETLKTFIIRTNEIVFADSDDLWPTTTLFQDDSLGLNLLVSWEYGF